MAVRKKVATKSSCNKKYERRPPHKPPKIKVVRSKKISSARKRLVRAKVVHSSKE